MSFGITSTGFKLKRFDDIEQETRDAFINEFGPQINLDGRSPLGQIKGVMDERLYLLWEALQSVYDSQYPASAEGVTLDNVASITGTTRLSATKSFVTARIFGDLGTEIPGGFIASVTGNPIAKFVSTTTSEIGPGINEVQDINFSAVPTSGAFYLRFDGEDTTIINFDDIAVDVQTALNSLSNLSGVTVSGDFTNGFTVTFAGDNGEMGQDMIDVFSNTLDATGAVSVTITETTRGYLPHVDILMNAQAAGATQAPGSSLTVIETPIGGVNSITNLLDATVGNDLETDAALKIRRLTNLQRVGSATLGGIKNAVRNVTDVIQVSARENTTSETVDLMPAKSFEIFALGGADESIAAAVFSSKPAGVEDYGTVSTVIQDSEGVNQTVKFSRPTEINVHIIVNITKNTDATDGPVYPDTGDDDIKNKIIDFTGGFLIGQDVIVNQLFTPINEVSGVFGVEVLVGDSASPTESDNLSVSSTEIAVFDTARVTVNS